MTNEELDLVELRSEIDQLDRQIVEALNRRAALVKKIWELKRASHLPLIDVIREQAILNQVQSLRKDPLPEKSVETIFRCILDEVRPK